MCDFRLSVTDLGRRHLDRPRGGKVKVGAELRRRPALRGEARARRCRAPELGRGGQELVLENQAAKTARRQTAVTNESPVPPCKRFADTVRRGFSMPQRASGRSGTRVKARLARGLGDTCVVNGLTRFASETPLMPEAWSAASAFCLLRAADSAASSYEQRERRSDVERRVAVGPHT